MISASEFKEAVEFGLNTKQLMAKFKMTAYQVSYKVRTMGLKILTSSQKLEEDKELIIDLFLNQGLTMKDIAEKWTDEGHKVSQQAVAKKLQKWKIRKSDNVPNSLKHLFCVNTCDVSRDLGEIGVMLIKRKSGKHHVIMDADEYLKLTSNSEGE